MKRPLPKLNRLLELARSETQRRTRSAASPDGMEVRRIAQQALAALPGRADGQSGPQHMAELRHETRPADAVSGRAGWQPAASRLENPPGPATWADAFERLCWPAASATVGVCLLLLAFHRPAPEPDATSLLLNWSAPSNPREMF
jgi:hypothetical protein